MSRLINMLSKPTAIIKALSLALLVCVVTACVTTSDSKLTRKANPEVAVERYVQLGLEYIKRADYAKARKHLNRALEIDSENAPANAALGLIYHQEAENRHAESRFLQALDSDPSYTRGRTYYAAFLFAEQRFDEALTQFKIASEDTSYESRAQIFTNIALCHLRLEQTDQALEAYEKTLRLDRFNGRALTGITELLLEQEQYKRAKYFYNRLVRVIQQQGLKHSSQSLWMGIRIASYYNNTDQESVLVELLRELYPESAEYEAYLTLAEGNS